MSYSWRDQQWPLKPASPREVVEGTLDDANTLARFYLDALGHRNPFVMYGTLALSMYGIGFGASYLAGAGARMAHWSGRMALTQFARSSAGIMGTTSGATFYSVLAAYYVGRNISHAIDPDKGEQRFHWHLLAGTYAQAKEAWRILNVLSPSSGGRPSHWNDPTPLYLQN